MSRDRPRQPADEIFIIERSSPPGPVGSKACARGCQKKYPSKVVIYKLLICLG